MVLQVPNIFSKSRKDSKVESSDNDDTSPPSPVKNTPKKASREKEQRPRPPNASRTRSKKPSSTSSSSYSFDPNSHPLNLPPEQLKRLSAMSSRSESPVQMDADQDAPTSALSASPPPMSPTAAPTTNGVNGDATPVPPPHRVPTKPSPSPPPPPPAAPPADAEAFKVAGNKYFKAGEFPMAIKEYTKGACAAVGVVPGESKIDLHRDKQPLTLIPSPPPIDPIVQQR